MQREEEEGAEKLNRFLSSVFSDKLLEAERNLVSTCQEDIRGIVLHFEALSWKLLLYS